MTDYKVLVKTARSFAEAERDYVPLLSNISALINESLDGLNWAGFYLMQDDELVVGPFQGKVACIRIAVGRGVCGTAVKEDKTIVVDDVHKFPGHIACDSASNSEIVVPIHSCGKTVGVLDIDSTSFSRFTERDREGLEDLVRAIEELADFSRLNRI